MAAAVLHLRESIDRPDSRVSFARSEASSHSTYHSFQDLDVLEPEVPPSEQSKSTSRSPVCLPAPTSVPTTSQRPPAAWEMRRQDSGYESITPARKDSLSSHHQGASTTSLASSSRKRVRPATRRSPRSAPVSQLQRSSCRSASPARSYRQSGEVQQEVTYFQFPQPEFTTEQALDDTPMATSAHSPRDFAPEANYSLKSEVVAYPLPPQTTHYWTSDQTRRLEYAAIDAASKGVRGWVMRHVVPECFVPTSKRRIGFEDDRGSVIRYRLDLDTEDDAEERASSNSRKGWRTWLFSVRRR
ncbi:hypothetical protein B0T21DRAFT_378190 [Apiosordaria backusii]|uniref:Uncharacterized protein n=1 Tax=Apiosordaria backusii TaxID=314023 RepID=A0AA39ZSL5_9PEZI|nr:hypothetical protein B0T21DRAFT_378190 [Apiosordaria backusii]